MKKRDLKLSLTKPLMASHYEQACNTTFGVRVFVHKKYYSRFDDLSRVLAKEGIYPKDYAYGIARHLCGWVKSKGWSHVPINIFCGKWAIKTYKEEVGNSVTLPATNAEEVNAALVYDEIRVARYYISNKGKKTYDQTVAELRPILSDDWLEMYDDDRLDIVRDEALLFLRKEHRRRAAESYEDLFS